MPAALPRLDDQDRGEVKAALGQSNARLQRHKRRGQHSSAAKLLRVVAHERPTRQQQAPHAKRKNKANRLRQHEAQLSAQVASWPHIAEHAATSDR